MGTLKQHIAFKIVTLLIALALLGPTLSKFAHTFEHHNHDVCNGSQKTHIHKVDLDCEFHDFQISSSFSAADNDVDLFLEHHFSKAQISFYFSIRDYQRLPFSLRGPPQDDLT